MAIFIFFLLLLSPLGAIAFAAGSPSITTSTSVIPDFLFQIPIGTTAVIKGADITSGKAIALYINMVYLHPSGFSVQQYRMFRSEFQAR